MSIERKRGVEPVSAMTGFPEFPEVQLDERGRVDAAALNAAVKVWHRDATRLLVDEIEALRRRVAALESRS